MNLDDYYSSPSSVSSQNNDDNNDDNNLIQGQTELKKWSPFGQPFSTDQIKALEFLYESTGGPSSWIDTYCWHNDSSTWDCNNKGLVCTGDGVLYELCTTGVYGYFLHLVQLVRCGHRAIPLVKPAPESWE